MHLYKLRVEPLMLKQKNGYVNFKRERLNFSRNRVMFVKATEVVADKSRVCGKDIIPSVQARRGVLGLARRCCLLRRSSG